MTTPAARDIGLRRLSDVTTWVGVGAVAVTAAFTGLAAHASRAATTPTAATPATSTSASIVSSTSDQFSSTPVPTASAAPSRVRSGAS